MTRHSQELRTGVPDFSRMEFFSAETRMWSSDSEVTDEGLLVGSPVFPWAHPRVMLPEQQSGHVCSNGFLSQFSL